MEAVVPANLTPQYKKAEEAYRNASTDEERRLALEEMLRQIPKHKGTEHLQADIKKRLKQLREGAEAKKGGAKHVDVFHVPRSGAGQIVLLGLPNSGKSAILAALTKARVNVADYPFTTDKPVPGMMFFEDVQIQLVDTPPLTADHAPPGLVQTFRGCDLIAIVIDLSTDPLEQLEIALKYLDTHRLIADHAADPEEGAGILSHPAFILGTKCDIAPPGTIETLRELCDRPLDFLEISSTTGKGLPEFAAYAFDKLNIIRIYAKKPGKEPDMKEPFTLPRNSTVTDLAYHIHRQLAEKLKSARAWNAPNIHDGQNVPRDHILSDKEIIELHFG
jgi:ribosome-interacting GTPase 1